MSLKDLIIQNSSKARCIDCSNFEILNNGKAPYCNVVNKLVLPMHIECIRKCEFFKNKSIEKE